MPTITIRNVPAATHAELIARAAIARQSLQEYVRAILVEIADRPDTESVSAGVPDRKQITGAQLPAENILSYRDLDRR